MIPTTKFIVYLIAIVTLLLSPLFFLDKTYLNFLCASNSTPFLNTSFLYITKMGEAVFIIPAIVLCSLLSIRGALLISTNVIVSTLLCTILKWIFQLPRPSTFVENFESISTHVNWELHSHLSFPSGHTTAAFAFFISLSLIIEKKGLCLLFIILAICVGLSRIYLLQHFFMDVYAGLLLGSTFSTLFYLFIYPKFATKLWANRGLIYGPA